MRRPSLHEVLNHSRALAVEDIPSVWQWIVLKWEQLGHAKHRPACKGRLQVADVETALRVGIRENRHPLVGPAWQRLAGKTICENYVRQLVRQRRREIVRPILSECLSSIYW